MKGAATSRIRQVDVGAGAGKLAQDWGSFPSPKADATWGPEADSDQGHGGRSLEKLRASRVWSEG